MLRVKYSSLPVLHGLAIILRSKYPGLKSACDITGWDIAAPALTAFCKAGSCREGLPDIVCEKHKNPILPSNVF